MRIQTLLILWLLALSACTPKTENAEPPLLKINGHTVTVAEFREDFANLFPTNQPLSAEERQDLERSHLVQIIDRRLALAEAERHGIVVPPEEVDAALDEHRRDYPEGAFEQMLKERGMNLSKWRQGLMEGLLIERAARRLVYDKVSVTEEEIAAYYEANRDEFHRPAQVRARHIVVGSREEGEEVLKALQGGEPFAEVALRKSLSPDAEEGGDLGFFSRGEMPSEIEAVVFSLPVGELSAIERSEYGHHVFLVDERRAAVRFGLDEVRDEIRDAIRSEKEEAAYREWIQHLRARGAIEVNWSLL